MNPVHIHRHRHTTTYQLPNDPAKSVRPRAVCSTITCVSTSFGRGPNSLISVSPIRAQARSASLCPSVPVCALCLFVSCLTSDVARPFRYKSLLRHPQVHGSSWLDLQCAGSSLAARGTNSTKPRRATCHLHCIHLTASKAKTTAPLRGWWMVGQEPKECQ